jgi:hypothetical protein
MKVALILTLLASVASALEMPRSSMTSDLLRRRRVLRADSSSSTLVVDPNQCEICSPNYKSKPVSLTFEYRPNGQNSKYQDATKASCRAGTYPASTTIQVNGNTFSLVSQGSTFTVEGSFGANTVFAFGDGTSCTVHTSCSVPLVVGDQIGPFLVVAGAGVLGGECRVNLQPTPPTPVPAPTNPPAECELCSPNNKDKPTQLTVMYLPDGKNSRYQDASKASCRAGTYPASASIKFTNKDGRTNVFEPVMEGDLIILAGLFDANSEFYFGDGSSCTIHTSCSAPLIAGDQIGPFLLVGGITKSGNECNVLPLPVPPPTQSPVPPPTTPPALPTSGPPSPSGNPGNTPVPTPFPTAAAQTPSPTPAAVPTEPPSAAPVPGTGAPVDSSPFFSPVAPVPNPTQAPTSFVYPARCATIIECDPAIEGPDRIDVCFGLRGGPAFTQCVPRDNLNNVLKKNKSNFCGVCPPTAPPTPAPTTAQPTLRPTSLTDYCGTEPIRECDAGSGPDSGIEFCVEIPGQPFGDSCVEKKSLERVADQGECGPCPPRPTIPPSPAPVPPTAAPVLPSPSPTGQFDGCNVQIPCITAGQQGVRVCVTSVGFLDTCVLPRNVQTALTFGFCGECPSAPPSTSPTTTPTLTPSISPSSFPVSYRLVKIFGAMNPHTYVISIF